MINVKKILDAVNDGGKYIRLIYDALCDNRLSERQIDILTTDALIEMDKHILKLEKELVKAKARALPDDFNTDNYRIVFSYEIKDEDEM